MEMIVAMLIIFSGVAGGIYLPVWAVGVITLVIFLVLVLSKKVRRWEWRISYHTDCQIPQGRFRGRELAVIYPVATFAYSLGLTKLIVVLRQLF